MEDILAPVIGGILRLLGELILQLVVQLVFEGIVRLITRTDPSTRGRTTSAREPKPEL